MWFITSVLARRDSIENPRLFVGTHRTFGYYKDSMEARKAITDNHCNMQENLYNYLVLENIGEGIHPEVRSEEWYEWVLNWRWMPCIKPTDFDGITNWGLG